MVDGRIVPKLHRGSSPRSLRVADSRLGLDCVTARCVPNLGVPTPQVLVTLERNLGSPLEQAGQAAAQAFQQPDVPGIANGIAIRV